MEEQIDRVLLDNFDVTSQTNIQHSTEKHLEVHSVFQNINSKDQEFIDHSLLTPEYITNLSNGFVIDIMENQGNDNQSQSNIYTGQTDTYSTDFQLQNAILQLVNNKHNVVRGNDTQLILTKNENIINDGDKVNIDTGFMSMDDAFLGDGTFRVFQPPVVQHSNHQHTFSVHSSSSPIALGQVKRISRHRLPFNSDDRLKIQYSNIKSLEVINDIDRQDIQPVHSETDKFSDQYFQQRSLSRKTLPHKKRITKKLKINSISETMPYQDEQDDCENEDSIVISSNPFSCQLCGHLSESQIEFFAHLKGHYEPNLAEISDRNPEAQFARPSSVILMTDIIQKRDCNFEDRNEINNSTIFQTHNKDKHEIKTIKEEDLLSDTQQINEIIIKNVSVQESYGQEYREQQSPNILQTPSHLNSPTKSLSEVEFSDAEDMLEGIRSVVDKVQESVEDTCDEMETISNSSKTPWFTNNAFSNSIYKEADTSSLLLQEDIKQINFSESRTQIAESPKLDTKTNFLEDVNHIIPNIPKRGRPKGSGKKLKQFKPSEDDKDCRDNSKKCYFCEKCNKQFNSYNALKYHDLSHTGNRLHHCSVCEKSFFAQSALKAHLRVHTGIKPYECDVCQRKFRQWGDLKYHTISIHSNEKNYQCEFCGKAFSRKYSLVIHRRIHTSEKNYKCEFCCKTFRASSYLQNHRKIHTGEKPYECNVCTKKFRVCGDLRRHERTHERSKKHLAHITKAKLATELP